MAAIYDCGMRRVLVVVALVIGCGPKEPPQQPTESRDEPERPAESVGFGLGSSWIENGITIIENKTSAWCAGLEHGNCWLTKRECGIWIESIKDQTRPPTLDKPIEPCAPRQSTACVTAREIMSGKITLLCASTMEGCAVNRDMLLAVNANYSGVSNCFVARHLGDE